MKVKVIFFLVVMLVISGCTTSWVKLDGTAESAEKISVGKKKCQIDEKMHIFNQEKKAMKYTLFIAKAPQEAKESWSEFFEDKENKINRDIETCMKGEGFKKISE